MDHVTMIDNATIIAVCFGVAAITAYIAERFVDVCNHLINRRKTK